MIIQLVLYNAIDKKSSEALKSVNLTSCGAQR